MSIFNKKTDAEKKNKAKIKAVKKEARADKREVRKDARADKQEARKDKREEKKDVREEARDTKQDVRQEKRDEMKDIRQSELKGAARRDAKSGVRDDKRDAIRDAKDDKRRASDRAGTEKKNRIDDVQDVKRTELDSIRTEEIEDVAALGMGSDAMINTSLALELLALTHVAQFQGAVALAAQSEVTGTMDGAVATCRLRGAIVRGAVGLTGKDPKSDTECFVARSDDGDVVVAFRGSETVFFDHSGAFKDWVLTDFRSHRMPYPPAPKSWPDQRWVHTGFWQAYNLVRNKLLAEVARQASRGAPARRIYVTGFSLGGALALLAALDIADGLRKTPVELFTFAAPRAGDASLNKLLAERVQRSILVALRGDPIVHLPPLGPNFPVTFKNPIGFNLAGIHIGLGTPIPSVGQEYRTADQLRYIDKNGVVKDAFPLAQVALNFRDHDWSHYSAALRGIAEAQAKARAPV